MGVEASRARLIGTSDREKLVLAVSAGVVIGYAALLVIAFFAHVWILDARGHPAIEDFAAFWSVGHLALHGASLAAYDPHLEHAAEVATTGHPFATPLGWSYPPLFLFVASALAVVPYTPAFLLWCVATLALHARVVAAIAERGTAFLVACAAPWTILGIMPGQNGFLTAALMGLALLNLERRPILSGLFVGLLSYKPQFGILFPLALAAGGYWRAFASAAVAVILANGLAAAVFGFATLGAFVQALTLTTQSHLVNSGLGWNKLQSVYGFARAAGLSGGIAWTLQGVMTAAVGLGVWLVWRRPFPFALKAAALAAATVLATPYVFVYDLPVLGVAIAWLFRHRGFDRTEFAVLAAAMPCMFPFLWLPYPTAFVTSLAVAAVVVLRCARILSEIPRSPRAVANERETLVVVTASAIVLGYALSLVLLYVTHVWILDAQGRPEVQDFVSFWSAGRLALKGAALSAYDPNIQHAAEAAVVGHGFDGALEWNYPPLFFFVVAALACLPYATAFVLWCAGTLALYAATIAKIAGQSRAAVVACAAPVVLAVLMSGQNGLLTASLIGIALLFLEKRPVLGGLVLGLLSYKPQFGILFPLALAAGGYWRSFVWAAVGAVVSNGLAAAVFGTGTIGAFVHAMTVTGDLRVAHAGMGWTKLESLYGLLRAIGVPAAPAWVMQGLATASIAIGIVLSWRSSLPYGLKAALLAAAIPLATPYILVYDLPILAVSAAFLYREKAFDRLEVALLASTVPSVIGLLWLPIPCAFFASLAVGAVALRRCFAMSEPNRVKLTYST
jgi:hypothetical protein